MPNDNFTDWADGEDDDGGGLGLEEEGEDGANSEDGAEDSADPGPQEEDAPQRPQRPAPRRPMQQAAPQQRRKPRKASRARRVWRAARRASELHPAVMATRALMGICADPAMECGAEMTFDLFKTGRGYSAVLRIPTAPGRAVVMASSPSSNKAVATKKGVNMARAAASSPLVQSVVPPQAKLALAAMQHPAAKAAMKKVFR